MNDHKKSFKCHTCKSTVYSTLAKGATVEIVPCPCCQRPVRFSLTESPRHTGMPISRRLWGERFDGMQWGQSNSI